MPLKSLELESNILMGTGLDAGLANIFALEGAETCIGDIILCVVLGLKLPMLIDLIDEKVAAGVVDRTTSFTRDDVSSSSLLGPCTLPSALLRGRFLRLMLLTVSGWAKPALPP